MGQLENMGQFFISLRDIRSFTCQLIFFTSCEWVLHGHPNMKIGDKGKTFFLALTSLLFYTAFSYSVRRIKDICIKEPTQTIRSKTNNTTNYIKFICRIILEWLKALVVVICLRKQGVHYDPSIVYFIITFLYYLSTEKLFIEVSVSLLELLNLDIFENLEHLYIPLIFDIHACIMGSIFHTYLLIFFPSKFVALSSYFDIYLRLKDTYINYWMVILDERKVYSSFRAATLAEIAERNDICAVCLNELTKAKITPCNHLFHPVCLKQCLKVSFLCPLCKENFGKDAIKKPPDED